LVRDEVVEDDFGGLSKAKKKNSPQGERRVYEKGIGVLLRAFIYQDGLGMYPSLKKPEKKRGRHNQNAQVTKENVGSLNVRPLSPFSVRKKESAPGKCWLLVLYQARGRYRGGKSKRGLSFAGGKAYEE